MAIDERIKIIMLKGEKGDKGDRGADGSSGGYDDTAIWQAVNNETTERTSQFSQAVGLVNTEAETRQSADTALQTAINAEAETRQQNVSNIYLAISEATECDSALSTTSERAVQNKVITNAINSINAQIGNVGTALDAINGEVI